jgi:cyclophilin family peptidyl-prolyl cis-trans isomerase
MAQADLDGKHVVFGEVVKGYEIIEQIENVKVNKDDAPLKPVVITACGEVTKAAAASADE